MWLLIALACAGPPPDPALRGRLAEALSFAPDGPLDLALGPPQAFPGYVVQTATFSLRPGFEVAAALWTPEVPSDVGVLVAHGHFDQGKSSPEAQEIAHRLAKRGAWVLAVDSPGVEEWDIPSRQIHFDAGAHNRAALAAGGSSALALQLGVLQRGLDVLADRGARRFGATGASGGAVLSFYLLALDPRVETAVMASFPPIPREAQPGGCACDQIPGWPGPDVEVLRLADRPGLWLSDVPQPRSEGLGREQDFRVLEGPHGYPGPMQAAALTWFADHLGLDDSPPTEGTPLLDLRTAGPGAGSLSIGGLRLPGRPAWVPAPWDNVAYELDCVGAGPTVLLVGGEAVDREALSAARVCTAVLPVEEGGVDEAIGRGRVYADRQLGGLLAAARRSGAAGVYAVGAWGLPASAAGLPFVVRRPIHRLDELVIDRDPAWVFVPGGQEGEWERRLGAALATGAEPGPLGHALLSTISAPSAPAGPGSLPSPRP